LKLFRVSLRRGGTIGALSVKYAGIIYYTKECFMKRSVKHIKTPEVFTTSMIFITRMAYS
jgi:hypothetical protein